MSIEGSPLHRTSTVDQLADRLRTQILDGKIDPGTQFREIELSEAYDVGRHSLRAALQVLVHEGLLAHEPHRGVFLREFTAQDVEDLFLLRTALEVETARLLVVRKTPIDEAVIAVEALEALTGAEPWSDVIEIDLRFHRSLVAALGSPRFYRDFVALQAELRLLNAQLKPSYERPDRVGAEHRIVLDAILSGRVSSAVKAIREHLDDGRADIVEITDRAAARERGDQAGSTRRRSRPRGAARASAAATRGREG